MLGVACGETATKSCPETPWLLVLMEKGCLVAAAIFSSHSPCISCVEGNFRFLGVFMIGWKGMGSSIREQYFM